MTVNEVNTTAADEIYPTVTPNELSLYWGSTRSDGGSKGSYDIWMATRANKGQPFGNVKNVQELNTTQEENPTWISSDGCRLYFYRGNPGPYQVFVATRTP